MNWTGHVLAAPRTRFEDAFTREELKRTGVYFLFGPDDGGSDLSKVYVGEGDEIGKRLYQHNKEKPFWERFIAVTSKDMNLTKAHVRFLEGRLLKLLEQAKKVKIDNKDLPSFELLPEADIADMEAFLDEIQLVLPVIGADFLKRPKTVRDNSKKLDTKGQSKSALVPSDTNVFKDVYFLISNPAAGIEARAREEAGEFVILAGSKGSLKEKGSFLQKQKRAREEALETGRIRTTSAKNFVFDEDVSFTSPSAAAVFLFGTSRNGRADWIVEDQDINYGAWKDQMIDLASNS